ncbi:MAG TPA: hypothetical protein VHW92_01015 [Mycobacteriales bacterium]|nr:hypothetical protein [Mycobacteriales bacterium]
MTPPQSRNTGRERAAAARARQQREERRRRVTRWTVIGVVILVIAGVAIAVGLSSGGGKKAPAATPTSGATSAAEANGPLGPEGIPLQQGAVLASASTAATGQTVDGVQCQTAEQVVYHIHAHLSVFDHGAPRPIPLGIGIVKPVVQHTTAGDFAQASHCYYWLHTHVQDGIIHIESPTKTVYTLGQFFDEWRQPLSTSQVGPVKGAVTAYPNGKRFSGNPRSIQLTPHAVIQLNVGSPAVAPLTVNWSKSSL